jgi:5'-phosphate synthase pdxT subunit
VVGEICIGVVAVQGAFVEHETVFARLGVATRRVRTSDDLLGLHALTIPGGETTTFRRVAGESGLIDGLRAARRAGIPMLGTCAGLISLADAISDGSDPIVGGLDITVRRNGYGRQIASFETEVDVVDIGDDARVEAVFIRAPIIERVGEDVVVHATLDGNPIAVSSGQLLGVTFHPELTSDDRFHQWLHERAVDYAGAARTRSQEDVSVRA